jgi:hypothetical protein
MKTSRVKTRIYRSDSRRFSELLKLVGLEEIHDDPPGKPLIRVYVYFSSKNYKRVKDLW